MKSGYAKRFTAAGMALALACGTAGVLSLSACGAASDTPADSQSIAEQEAVAPESYTFTDDMGNEVTVNDPQRVVATPSPSTTSTSRLPTCKAWVISRASTLRRLLRLSPISSL